MLRRLPLGLLPAVFLLTVLALSACSGDERRQVATPTASVPAPSATPEAPACGGATAGCATPATAEWLDGVSQGISMGPAFVIDASTPRLRVEDGEQGSQPVGAYGGRIIVERTALRADRASSTQQFELWDPATRESEPLWQGVADKWDVAGEVAGAWMATARGGRGDGPQGIHAGQVILRNLETGEVRPITKSDEEVDLAVGMLSMSGSLVAWSDTVRKGPFPVETRVHLYDLESGVTSTVADVRSGSSASPPAESVGMPSVGGRRVAWQHWNGSMGATQIEILDVDSGETREVPVMNLAGFALSLDGVWLAWNEGETDEFALNLETGEKLHFAHGARFVFRGEGAFSWTPAAEGGPAGVFDLGKREVRLVPGGEGPMGVARVLGSWFVWQAGTGQSDRYYYFAPYEAGGSH